MTDNQYSIPGEPRFLNAIQAIWQIDHLTAFLTEHIIPKGVIEIIFNFSDSPPTLAQLGTSGYRLPNCFINGFNKTPIQLQLPKRHVFFGVVLQPLAIKKIFKIPAREFSDLTVDLTLIDPEFGRLWHRLAEHHIFANRVAIFLDWIKSHSIELQPQEQLINDFLYAVDRHDMSVTGLANALCYSPRQLSRKILDVTSMNTEELLLYKKYLHAMHLIHHTDQSLTAVAYNSRFSDQSHFIRSFKAFTNMTPGDYKRSKSFVKGHMYENVR